MLVENCRSLRRPQAALALVAALVLSAGPAAATDTLTPYDVAALRSVGSAVVSPDGTHIAYTLSVPRDPFAEEDGSAWSELHVADADGPGRPYVAGEVRVGTVSWRPGGEEIAFLAEREGDESRSLYLIPLAGGEARRVLTHDTDIDDYSFSPDGSRVAFLATEALPEERQELLDKGFDADVYEEELRPVRVWLAELGGEAGNEPRALELEGSASELHWSPAGEALAVALAPTPLIDDEYMERRVRVVDVAGGTVTASFDNPGKLGEVAWSPDGRRLAMISAADLNDPSAGRLLVAPASGGELVDLLPGYLGEVEDLAWLDPETLVFVGHQGVDATLSRVDVGGGGRRDLLAAGAGPIWRSLSISRGGDRMALVADAPDHPRELYDHGPGSTAPRRLSDSNPRLAEVRLAPQEVITWTARDGLELQGILIRPLEEGQDLRHPLILSVHGGPESHLSNGWLTSYSYPGQVGAARGFALFYPNYRGSTGRGVEFSKLSQGDPAGKEFDDLVDAVDHLVAIGLADGERVGITGGSYGGYATGWASTYYSERFAAGVMFVGISELIAKAGTTDIPREEHLVHARVLPWERWQTLLERSPAYHVEESRTPLLILGGTDDPRVHPSQSLILFRFLKQLGQAPVRLVRYPGEQHGNRRAASRLDYNLRMLRWFEHYLQGEGGTPPPPFIDPTPAETEMAEEEAEPAA